MGSARKQVSDKGIIRMEKKTNNSHIELIVCASTVINYLCQLQLYESKQQDTLPSEKQLEYALSQFKLNARKKLLTDGIIEKAHYLLCTVVDEFYYYGANKSIVKASSLLAKYHNDTKGGEVFFNILNDCLLDPENNCSMLRLIHLLLSIGFKGKFALYPNGTEILSNKKKTIYQVAQINEIDSEETFVSKIVAKNPYRFNCLHKISLLLLFSSIIVWLILNYILNNQAENVQLSLVSALSMHL